MKTFTIASLLYSFIFASSVHAQIRENPRSIESASLGYAMTACQLPSAEDLKKAISDKIYSFESLNQILLRAVKDNRIDLIELLLSSGADPSASKYHTMFVVAAEADRVQIMKVLLEHNVDVNETRLGWTALHAAIEGGSLEAVALLLSKGARVHDSYKGMTPALIMNDIYGPRGGASILKLLLDAGAAVDAQDSHGRTMLMKAAMKADVESVKLLLDYSPNLALRDHDGKKAMDYAHWDVLRPKAKRAIRKLLRQYNH